MRRLAILFAFLAALSVIAQVALPTSAGAPWSGPWHAPRSPRRPRMSFARWRALLFRPIRLLQRATSSGAGPWLGLSN